IKIVISIVILTSLAIVSYVLLDIGKEVKINNPIENKAVDNKSINKTEQITTKIDQISNHIQPLEQVSAEIASFNEQLTKDLTSSFDDKSAKKNAIIFLQDKQRKNSVDVVEKINEYFNDIVENQIEVSDLILSCFNAKKKLAKIEKGLTESNNVVTERSFNMYYFYQGLLESKICNDMNNSRDPFFAFLKSARKGNMLSQLLLTDHLYSAMIRKLIDTWKRPLEYMNLRDEAISYLKILAAKGVIRASVRLANIYSSRSIFVPPNRVLEYYYTFLAKKQGGIEAAYVRDPNDIYYYLTDKQKAIVDRMTENL
ncbi:MAG: hypothetical protein L3J53_05815, partial [Proteobacteria bacterium]|nr:hypothetical protein [Pseudomonadota bacterium]